MVYYNVIMHIYIHTHKLINDCIGTWTIWETALGRGRRRNAGAAPVAEHRSAARLGAPLRFRVYGSGVGVKNPNP